MKERCHECDLPLADAAAESHPENCQHCESLRWQNYGSHCSNTPIDWRGRALAAEARVVADRERVRTVVCEAVLVEGQEHPGRDVYYPSIHADAIAARVADQLAMAAVGLSAKDVTLLQTLHDEMREFGIGMNDDDEVNARTATACIALLDRLIARGTR